MSNQHEAEKEPKSAANPLKDASEASDAPGTHPVSTSPTRSALDARPRPQAKTSHDKEMEKNQAVHDREMEKRRFERQILVENRRAKREGRESTVTIGLSCIVLIVLLFVSFGGFHDNKVAEETRGYLLPVLVNLIGILTGRLTLSSEREKSDQIGK